MPVFSISKMPTGCAPTVSYDQNNPGWTNCEYNCDGCISCKPDNKSDCGQMMIASGLSCAPPGCVAECCKSSNQADKKPIPKKPSSGGQRSEIFNIIFKAVSSFKLD